MNARTEPENSFQEIDIGSISVSKTAMQVHRRASLNKEALKALADNVRQVGVIQPVLVRHFGKAFELVAGERRFLASIAAGKKTIPAMVRTLSDKETVELQVIENKQREDLHELIEAEGFEELMLKHKYTAEQVAEKVGMSRRYVFNRLKLLDLCPELREAFLAGKMNGSIAILLARLPVHDLQKQAFKDIVTPRWNDDEPLNYRKAAAFMQQNYMLRLADAPFDVKDLALVPAAGACGACPKRTGNQKELFADVKNADVCTDPSCFTMKKTAHTDALRKAAEAKGQTVITGAQAKKIKPHEYGGLQDGYVRLDAVEFIDGKSRSYTQMLGKDKPQTMLLQDPHDPANLIEIGQRTQVVSAIRAKGIKIGSAGHASTRTNSDLENERKAKHETAIARALFDAIHVKPIKIDHDLLALLALFVYENAISYEHHEIVDPLHGLDDKKDHDKIILKMTDAQLARLLVDCMTVRQIKHQAWNASEGAEKTSIMATIARKASIDVAAIRKPFQQAYDERAAARKARAGKIRAKAKTKSAGAAPAKKAKKT